MTDNVFEIETTAIDHRACAARRLRRSTYPLLLRISECGPQMEYSSVCSVLALPRPCKILRKPATSVEHAGAARSQFVMMRVARQGCPASWVLLTVAFDPVCKWLMTSSHQNRTGHSSFKVLPIRRGARKGARSSGDEPIPATFFSFSKPMEEFRISATSMSFWKVLCGRNSLLHARLSALVDRSFWHGKSTYHPILRSATIICISSGSNMKRHAVWSSMFISTLRVSC